VLGKNLSPTKFPRVFCGWFRAALVIAALASSSLIIGLHSAKAALSERLVGFGSELARWEGFRLSTSPRRISVNGAELELVVATTALSVADALNRLEGACAPRGGVVGADTLPKLLRSTTVMSRSWLNGRIRRDSEHDGVLACLDTGGPLGLGELNARLRAFAKTSDLKDLGALRYATARRTGNVTTVLFLWSEGAVPLRQMFPSTGEAPGIDPPGVPRPKGASRLLAALEHDAPFSITVYRTNAPTAQDTLAWYRAELAASGFLVEPGASGSLLARQGQRTLVVTATQTSRGIAAAIAEMK
jgi:hypothetical protein